METMSKATTLFKPKQQIMLPLPPAGRPDPQADTRSVRDTGKGVLTMPEIRAESREQQCLCHPRTMQTPGKAPGLQTHVTYREGDAFIMTSEGG